jgi:hypothetical protein
MSPSHKRKKNRPAPKIGLCSRDDALAAVAGLLSGRRHFLIPCLGDAVGLSKLTAVARAWTVFNDNGSDVILRMDGHGFDGQILDVCISLVPGLTAQTMAVPKDRVPWEDLAELCGLDSPAVFDHQDIVVLSFRELDVPFELPLFFVDAIDRCDPILAATLRAQSRPI